MVRFVIIGIVIAVAFTLYSLVDAAMTDGSRARGVPKPAWVVLIVVLPVLGGILWFVIGKGEPAPARPRPTAPDDDPRFAGTRMSQDDLDAHMRDLERRLRELDAETFPGESAAAGDPEGDAPAPDAPTPAADAGAEPEAASSDADPEPPADDPAETTRPRPDDDAAQR